MQARHPSVDDKVRGTDPKDALVRGRGSCEAPEPESRKRRRRSPGQARIAGRSLPVVRARDKVSRTPCRSCNCWRLRTGNDASPRRPRDPPGRATITFHGSLSRQSLLLTRPPSRLPALAQPTRREARTNKEREIWRQVKSR